MLFIKDSGLRVSDVRRINYGDIAKQLENGETIIQLNIITEKANLLAKTFIGEEAIQALKEDFDARNKDQKTQDTWSQKLSREAVHFSKYGIKEKSNDVQGIHYHPEFEKLLQT